ncbi:MAG: alpha/beta hydrolase, partial [Muribaculaceae bacterium]|nr:alpha/beta hydrolase [Muribaculaceae bacterium]
LLKQYHGEWEYDTAWKMIYSPPVTASWIRSISRAQSRLMKNASHITVPVLVMHSSRGLHECGWTEACQSADIVLDPQMIASRGVKLGKQAEVVAIDSGIHDLILSELPVREQAYRVIFDFIERTR